MRRSLFVLGAVALAGCGQFGNGAADQTAAKAAQPKKAKPPYCFFKDSETKAWKASRDAKGDVLVKGKAFRLDSRYEAVLLPPVVTGNSAEARPSITVNDTGYAALDNWRDVSATIPNSSAVHTVTVRRGDKSAAELT